MTGVFKCRECGESFTEEEAGAYGEPGRYEMVCPNCGSFEFDEADECMECGETYFMDELHVFDTEIMTGYRKMYPKFVTLCNRCFEKVKKDIAAGEDIYGIKEELENG